MDEVIPCRCEKACTAICVKLIPRWLAVLPHKEELMFTDVEAKEIWKARWLGEKLRSLVTRFDRDPRRFYELWQEKRNKGSRLEAFKEFQMEYPELALSVDPSPHTPERKVVRKIGKPIAEQQMALFD
jgi:hypothetical protein